MVEGEQQLSAEEMLAIQREMFIDSWAVPVGKSQEEYQAAMKEAWGKKVEEMGLSADQVKREMDEYDANREKMYADRKREQQGE